jgi:hypothetical protein
LSYRKNGGSYEVYKNMYVCRDNSKSEFGEKMWEDRVSYRHTWKADCSVFCSGANFLKSLRNSNLLHLLQNHSLLPVLLYDWLALKSANNAQIGRGL